MWNFKQDHKWCLASRLLYTITYHCACFVHLSILNKNIDATALQDILDTLQNTVVFEDLEYIVIDNFTDQEISDNTTDAPTLRDILDTISHKDAL